MSNVNLRDMLTQATTDRYAVGAFNVVDAMTARAVIQAGEAKRAPVIVQTSAAVVELYGAPTMAAMVRPLAEDASVPVALHLDHCNDLDLISACIEAGWTSVMIDASTFPFEENVAMTKQVVETASGTGVTVEGELGTIVAAEDDIAVREQGTHLIDPVQAVEFVDRTGVDVLAPSIGTAHGVYKGEPKIAFDLLETVAGLVGAPIAIHGGTGLSDEVFSRCIALGGAKVNVSTQIKYAFRDALAGYFAENPDDVDPVRILTAARDATQRTIEDFIDRFGSAGKA